MTKPTLESLNEAALAAGFGDSSELKTEPYSIVDKSIIAHALTLDKLHNRKEVSEAETFYREVVAARLGDPLWEYPLDGNDREAIALIEAKFAELRAPKEHAWIEWYGGECPVAEGADCEVKFRSGVKERHRNPEFWSWKHFDYDGDIIAYRVL